jgi:hypothetical protein
MIRHLELFVLLNAFFLMLAISDRSTLFLARMYRKLTLTLVPTQKTRSFVAWDAFTPDPFKRFFHKPARARRSSVMKGIRAPAMVTRCVKYTDWRYWEDNAQLVLSCEEWRDVDFLRR